MRASKGSFSYIQKPMEGSGPLPPLPIFSRGKNMKLKLFVVNALAYIALFLLGIMYAVCFIFDDADFLHK